MSINVKAIIRLRFNEQKQIATLIKALTPETKANVTRRAKVTLEKNDLFLVLTVEAEDTIALRATLNAYLRWVNSTINVMNVVKNT